MNEYDHKQSEMAEQGKGETEGEEKGSSRGLSSR